MMLFKIVLNKNIAIAENMTKRQAEEWGEVIAYWGQNSGDRVSG